MGNILKISGEVLGQGQFGIVHKANLKSLNKNDGQIALIEVAVKTQLPNMGVEEFKNLLREIKIMSHVGSHDCVVSFTGACTQNIKKSESSKCINIFLHEYLILLSYLTI